MLRLDRESLPGAGVGERRERCTQVDIATWLSFLGALPIRADGDKIGRACPKGWPLLALYSLSAWHGR